MLSTSIGCTRQLLSINLSAQTLRNFSHSPSQYANTNTNVRFNMIRAVVSLVEEFERKQPLTREANSRNYERDSAERRHVKIKLMYYLKNVIKYDADAF